MSSLTPAAPVGRVAMVIASLSAGGSERVMSLMANHWAQQGRSVTVITLSGGEDDHYVLDPRVRRVALDMRTESRSFVDAVLGNATRAWVLRRALNATGIRDVISFGDRMNVLTLLATTGSRARVIAAERNDPRHHPMGRLWGSLRRLMYRRSAALVVQTEGLRAWAEAFVRTERVHVIRNPLMPTVSLQRASLRDEGRTILAAGRLAPQKGFDILLDAFSLLASRQPEWRLMIAGDGPDRPSLQAAIRDRGLTERVELLGIVDDLEDRMRAADLFVLSSRYEGFPNVLLEAMATGLPVVSTDCPSGPRDIITPGVDGELVPPQDPPALSAAIERLLVDPARRKALGEAATSVRDRFSVDSVMIEWDRVLRGIEPKR